MMKRSESLFRMAVTGKKMVREKDGLQFILFIYSHSSGMKKLCSFFLIFSDIVEMISQTG